MESLVIVRRGGVINGTWMYSEVAVAYAAWLSPEAGEWCGARVKEIMRGEITKQLLFGSFTKIYFQLAAQPRKDEDNKGHTRASDF